ncbi:hypothetical protein C8P68_11416 [Mucilaginibacter yixingensis]|uniref:Yip1-like protein n=1 Tax=Mucilaginibacter yixingensis TaxID=1295612 RepID=A0A2T5J4D4_9SPHI|nr:hypothetical protein [Mucilaginibacter yixingensis]PTQ92141.1 hypothetical protein C8P68_11416 [Mucilaginibacter yixingensis]
MDFFTKRVLSMFCLLLLLSYSLIYVANHLILTPEFYSRSGNSLSMIASENINLYANVQRWSYLYETIYCFVKIFLTGSLLYTGLYALGQKVEFRKVIWVSVVAEFVFLPGAAAKIAWFYFYYPTGTLLDWHRTYVLSMLSFFEDLPAVWYYPLQTVNLFELAYWFLLAFGLSRISTNTFDDSLKIVLKTYVPVLVLWVICVCFASIMFFPTPN